MAILYRISKIKFLLLLSNFVVLNVFEKAKDFFLTFYILPTLHVGNEKTEATRNHYNILEINGTVKYVGAKSRKLHYLQC